MSAINKLTTVASIAVASLLAAACGQGAQAVLASGKISARQSFVSLVDRDAVPYDNEDLPEVTEVVEIRLTMREFGYGAQEIEIPVGTTARFIFDNGGAVEHEAIVGDMDLQMAQMRGAADHDEDAAERDEHEDAADHDEDAADHDEHEDAADHDEDAADHDEDAAEHDEHDADGTDDMDDMAMGDGHGDHGDAPVLILESGASGDLVVTFDEVGQFIIGCHIPGHWEAGMRAEITVL